MNVPEFEHRHTVLVVDDEPPIHSMLRAALSPENYDLVFAQSASEAEQILSIEVPCLVLCDVHLGGKDGFALCRQIRSGPRTAHIAVALMSGRADDRHYEQGIEAGASDYIKKPFDRAEIRLRIRNLISLHESYRRRRQLLDCATQGILAVALPSRRIILANPAICTLLGYTEQALLGMTVEDIIGHTNEKEGLAKFEAHCRGERNTGKNVPLTTRTGERRFVDVSSSPMVIEGVSCVLGFLTDVTDRMDYERRLVEEERRVDHMETELRHAQKLEAVGRLAAGIAHEINTPTQFVGDNTRFLQEGFESLKAVFVAHNTLLEAARAYPELAPLCSTCDAAAEEADVEFLEEEIPRAAEQSLEGVGRIARIVRAMKEFAHPGGGDKVYTDINKLIETTVTVSKNEWKYCADLEIHQEAQLPEAYCLPGEINQVLLNLIVNAAHAVEDVRTDTTKGHIDIYTEAREDRIEIRIADTGCGIPGEIHDKIMEPFFTTKEVGRGTGQGLAIARNVIVDKHGGSLSFQSTTGKGTTFYIELPIHPPKGRPERSGAEAPP